MRHFPDFSWLKCFWQSGTFVRLWFFSWVFTALSAICSPFSCFLLLFLLSFLAFVSLFLPPPHHILHLTICAIFSIFPSLCPSLSILFVSVTNLFKFTSPPVFYIVSLFISLPFKMFFCGFDRKVPAGGKIQTSQKLKTWRSSFNLWNLNGNELN